MNRTTRQCLLLLTISALFVSARAKTPDRVRAQCRKENRPCIGLVLSGGGARGFAHAGVLQVLERMRIPIDVVTGTSMGSMVGGAYAAGYTPKEIEELILKTNWKQILEPVPQRNKRPWHRKVEDATGLANPVITIKENGDWALPLEVVPSTNFSNFLTKNMGAWDTVQNLEDLPIPFAAVATDLVTGERVVLNKDCPLQTSMRASMSVPVAFTPARWQGRMLVDGGLVDNLPVALAREMGADIVIAVNLGTPLMKRERLTNVFTVTGQMINLLTEQNVNRSLASLHQDDILIKPNLEEFASTSLEGFDTIIERGREAARKEMAKLLPYARSPMQYAVWQDARRLASRSYKEKKEFLIGSVQVTPLKHVNEKVLEDESKQFIGKEVTHDQLARYTRQLWAQGDFRRVSYRIQPGPDQTQVLVIEPKEKYVGYHQILFGGRLETDFESNDMVVIMAHSGRWMNSWGGQWYNQLTLGDEQGFATEWIQPLGVGSPWFIQPHAHYHYHEVERYENDRKVGVMGKDEKVARLMLGYTIDQIGYIKAGLGYGRIGERFIYQSRADENFHSSYIKGRILLDTLDSISFPTKGYRLNLTSMWGTKDHYSEATWGQTDAYSYDFSALLPITYGQWTLLTSVRLAKSPYRSAYELGGATHISGTSKGRWTGSNKQFMSLTLSRRIPGLFKTISGYPLWMGASYHYGRVWNEVDSTKSDSLEKEWQQSFSLFLGVDTLIGPMYLGAGRAFGRDSAIYFRWGNLN